MSDSPAATNIEEIAGALAAGRDQGRPTVLFLGSRAGGFFGNEFLYDTLKNFSLLDFGSLTNIEKFRESYYVLKKFTESEKHNILVGALATLRYREEDKLLAELIKAGFFETIISTNVDSLLEDAYGASGLRTPMNYQVFISDENDLTKLEQHKPKYGSLVKVFGDLESRHYHIADEAFDFQAIPGLQKFLTSVLSQNVLMIGYDLVWNHAIEQAFPEAGSTIWYVNETELPQNTYLASILDQRKGRLFQNDRGSYSSFLLALYDFLEERIGQKEVATPPFLVQPQLPEQERNKIFISYSYPDRAFLERLTTHLKGYMLKNTVDIWDETKISPGRNWKEEIKRALTRAKVAVLLVSSNFLSSDFSREQELPILLEAAQSGNVQLLPVIIDPTTSLFYDRDPLNQFQIVNSSSKPLRWMQPYEQEVVWNKLAEQIYSILHS